MTLGQALELIHQPAPEGETAKSIWLACGFTPLHVATFIEAHGRQRFPAGVKIRTGHFDDVAGSLERAAAEPGDACVVLLEWADLDPRLGLRAPVGARPSLFDDIEKECARRLQRIAAALHKIPFAAVSGPSLPLPPAGITVCAQDSAFELRLRTLVDSFLADVASLPGVRVISAQELALVSAPGERLDARMALTVGFPYSLAHADAVAALAIETLYPPEPKKGIITDLDDTLWLGILGEIGVEAVAWSLERHAQAHGLYQQFLASLAERGVMIAIASKNEPALVRTALERADLLLPGSAIFPVEVSWGPKSAAAARILQAWNIGAHDVVFIDDSPMELAEVSAAFPEMTCLRFPTRDPRELWELFRQMRRLFARQQIQDEDRIRVASLRADPSPVPSGDEFLAQLQGRVTIDLAKDAKNTRAFELVNKTNQFNLNGRRWTPGEWAAMLNDGQRFLATISYEDRFGPLGKIAVVSGTMHQGVLRIDTWVLSCRAFSRRIEFQTLAYLVAQCSARQVVLDYRPTDRNGPVREFLEQILAALPGSSPVEFTAGQFAARCPVLTHEVRDGNYAGATAT